MKNIFSIILLLLLAVAPSSMGQGQILFNNRVPSVGLVAPIYGVNPNTPLMRLSGNAITNGGSTDYTGFPLLYTFRYTAELWAESAPGANDFAPLVGARASFRSPASLNGFFQPSGLPILVPGVPGPTDGSWRFQVRAWDNGSLDHVGTYAEAVSVGRAVGVSDIFTSPVIAAPNMPGQILGFTSFNLTIVPEPSAVVLGALAGAALLWRRRVGRKV